MTLQKKKQQKYASLGWSRVSAEQIKKLIKKFSFNMFSKKLAMEKKAFSAVQKIRQLKKRILKLKGKKSKSKVIMPMMLIKKIYK